jgi:hypothetical protein
MRGIESSYVTFDVNVRKSVVLVLLLQDLKALP